MTPDLRPVRQSYLHPTRFGLAVWCVLAAIQVLGFAVVCWLVQ